MAKSKCSISTVAYVRRWVFHHDGKVISHPKQMRIMKRISHQKKKGYSIEEKTELKHHVAH